MKGNEKPAGRVDGAEPSFVMMLPESRVRCVVRGVNLVKAEAAREREGKGGKGEVR